MPRVEHLPASPASGGRMSASQTLFPGWMEIVESAVHDEARQHAEEEALAALVDQYATILYRVAFSVLRNRATPKTPCRKPSCAFCVIVTRSARFAIIASG